MFGLAAFVVAAVGQELWRGVRARRAMSDDSVPRALVQLVRRNRRRYGGYIVHVGVVGAVRRRGGLVGVPGRPRRPARRRPEREGRRLRHHLREADGRPARRPTTAGSRRSTSARVMRVSRDGKTVGTLRTERVVLPHRGPDARPGLALLRGRGDQRGRPARRACGATSGARSRPTCATCASRSRRATRSSPQRQGRCRRRSASVALAKALDRPHPLLRRRTRRPATFRLIVSPLVSWIWIGALIVFCGGLIALWPTPRRAPRPVAARYAARVAQELGRA